LWVTEAGTGRIGRLTVGGQLTEFALPSDKSAPNEIVAGPDGALWFTEPGVKKIGRITTSGDITETSSPDDATPISITVGPDNNLWASAGPVPEVLRITTSMQVTPFAIDVPRTGTPAGIAAGADGNLWVAAPYDAKIVRVTPTGVLEHFNLASNSYPFAMTKGPDGNVWFTNRDHIGRISPQGVITQFAVPDGDSGLFDLAVGPDGALYYTENLTHRLGRITVSGVGSVFAQLSGPPVGVVTGPDAQVWFAINVGDKVGHIKP
jgi:virginiamycin B lyase